MTYEIKQTLLGNYNRPRTALAPQGITVHDTEGHNDTDEANFNYFNTANRNASAHYFCDYDSISQFIPDNERAWHAGPTANSKYLSLEMCHEDDPTKFDETWKRGVWLVASKCVQYGWNSHNQDQVMTHHMVADRWHESNHSDPDSYFAQHGKNWDDFIADVDAEIAKIKAPSPLVTSDWVPTNNPICAQVRVIIDGLNIRKGPGTSFPVIGVAPKGKVYNVTANINDWHEIIINDTTKGYVFGNKGTYLELV